MSHMLREPCHPEIKRPLEVALDSDAGLWSPVVEVTRQPSM